MGKPQEDLILLIVTNAEVNARCVMDFFEKGNQFKSCSETEST